MAEGLCLVTTTRPTLIPKLVPFIVLLAAISGCDVKRDDTTGATRQLAAEILGVDYSDVKPTTTLGDLGCDDLDVIELVMRMEESFDISFTDDDLESLSSSSGWKSVTILQLANLARSKRKF
ncbi:MAG: phosphopantetheine-binding protein [Pirellulaceae bacterium]